MVLDIPPADIIEKRDDTVLCIVRMFGNKAPKSALECAGLVVGVLQGFSGAKLVRVEIEANATSPPKNHSLIITLKKDPP